MIVRCCKLVLVFIVLICFWFGICIGCCFGLKFYRFISGLMVIFIVLLVFVLMCSEVVMILVIVLFIGYGDKFCELLKCISVEFFL